MSLFAFWRLAIVGLAVSLAERETRAARSTRVFDTNHCSDPLIPLRVSNPFASSLFSIHLVQVLWHVEICTVQFPGEVLLVHLDGIIILLKISYSTKCEGVCFPFPHLWSFFKLSFALRHRGSFTFPAMMTSST